MNRQDAIADVERLIARLRGQLQNCVNHLERANRNYRGKNAGECIESANRALYESLHDGSVDAILDLLVVPGDEEIERLHSALGNYSQCDAEGIMCEVSRQAVEESRDLIESLASRVRELGQWIPITERLPNEITEFVLVGRMKKGKVRDVMEAHQVEGRFYAYRLGFKREYVEPTHWKPEDSQ